MARVEPRTSAELRPLGKTTVSYGSCGAPRELGIEIPLGSNHSTSGWALPRSKYPRRSVGAGEPTAPAGSLRRSIHRKRRRLRLLPRLLEIRGNVGPFCLDHLAHLVSCA